MTKHTRPVIVYTLMVVLGVAAFLYPFWIPSTAFSSQAHSGDAPLVAALVGALVIVAVALEVRRGTMNGATVAILGMLSACAGLLRLFDLPGGGSGIFFLVVLAGAAFGPRFGLLLGLCSMAVSAIVTGGIGPWLPFQMLALAWMGGMAGFVGMWTARLAPRAEVVVLAAYGWVWGFLYGGDHEPVVLAVRARRRARLASRARLERDARPLLVVLRGHVARVGRRRRDHERAPHPRHRRRAPAHPPPLRPPPRTRRRLRRPPRTGVTSRRIATAC